MVLHPAVLAADAGTSSLKAVLYDREGRILRVAVRRYAYSTPESGWAEGDPEAWWTAFCDAVRELRADDLALDQIEAIAFTGQMHSAVLLDPAHHVIAPTILWLDRRAAGAEKERADRAPNRAVGVDDPRLGPEAVRARAGDGGDQLEPVVSLEVGSQVDAEPRRGPPPGPVLDQDLEDVAAVLPDDPEVDEVELPDRVDALEVLLEIGRDELAFTAEEAQALAAGHTTS